MTALEQKLLQDGLVAEQALTQAREIAGRTFRPLAEVLVENDLVDEADLLKIVAEQHGLAFLKLKDLAIDPAVIRCVPAKLASHYTIMPVNLEGGTLTIAVSSVMDTAAAEDIETNLGYQVDRALACKADISSALRRYYGVGADTVERILADDRGRLDGTISLDESHDLEKMAEDASVVRLVNQLLQEAIGARATDIHLEIGRDEVKVRRRVDGILYDTRLPHNIKVLYPAIISRIKLMSGLNIVERRLPQDGRSRVSIGNDAYDLRISVVPSVHGEDVVARILPSTMLFDLQELGFSGDHLQSLQDLIRSPHGIIFVTGPTGSGKSTTLYACLSRLNTKERKIITIEDPVEYELKGITQTQINPKIGLTFAHALRSMLRHDPDIMMVGEVRDRETAEIAIQTSMTGHLVLSTLHTNDAAAGAVRLIDMGVDPYLITSTVLVFVAQRLVRLICSGCKEKYERDGQTLYRGTGCRQCNNSGYHGRIAISEFIPLVQDVQEAILRRESARELRARADSLGMSTLAADGWNKVSRGLTTAEEVLRVTKM
ncbi:MAG: ATPase, T2SS/T4P/T4SS family [Kiritimatiellia bacterium]|nr:ATPase, T2SS/T4P/T4SS family [Kiritimatiellia bacterium]MDP6849025.1 ATPase, T2SS/T4P/T4SS family [Kiritimatiellia bacterium]